LLSAAAPAELIAVPKRAIKKVHKGSTVWAPKKYPAAVIKTTITKILGLLRAINPDSFDRFDVRELVI
jgi:hypothetical protein